MVDLVHSVYRNPVTVNNFENIMKNLFIVTLVIFPLSLVSFFLSRKTTDKDGKKTRGGFKTILYILSWVMFVPSFILMVFFIMKGWK